jgi:hypothetical protein
MTGDANSQKYAGEEQRKDANQNKWGDEIALILAALQRLTFKVQVQGQPRK